MCLYFSSFHRIPYNIVTQGEKFNIWGKFFKMVLVSYFFRSHPNQIALCPSQNGQSNGSAGLGIGQCVVVVAQVVAAAGGYNVEVVVAATQVQRKV